MPDRRYATREEHATRHSIEKRPGAVSEMAIRMKNYPQYHWAILVCNWQDDDTWSKKKRHFHVVPWALKEPVELQPEHLYLVPIWNAKRNRDMLTRLRMKNGLEKVE